MSKPILDKAEVSIDFPDKFYHGSFSSSSRYDVEVDDEGVHIALDRVKGEKRHVAFHLQHHLFSSILDTIAEAITDKGGLPDLDRNRLKDAVAKLTGALKK